ncbi:hypothetical protein HY625_02145 [Candidatus Uhrbacteria bacterium]|nr:hypothetical protein [Candidatus Uhrbacteria bacterium]
MSRWEKTKFVLWVLTLVVAVCYGEIYRRNSDKLVENSNKALEKMDHPLQGFLGGGREKK